MNTKLIVANWKMNPASVKDAKKIIEQIKKKSETFTNISLIICPPFIFLNEVFKIISLSKKIILGAQDVFVGQGSSHTGEIGIELLKKIGVQYVLIGHSERRDFLDSGEIIKEKTWESLKKGFKVILCIGEKERNEHGDYYNEIKKQIEDTLIKLPKKLIKNLIIAYEPVWAISKSKNSEAIKPEQLYEITIFIKRLLSDILGIKETKKIKLLYGGSVNKNNFKEISKVNNIDGFLIGRESLNVKNFLELITEL
ncbi:MAG: triose-phosphate isomerase [bacterium]